MEGGDEREGIMGTLSLASLNLKLCRVLEFCLKHDVVRVRRTLDVKRKADPHSNRDRGCVSPKMHCLYDVYDVCDVCV